VTRVLVTGATGFVGRAACAALADHGCVVRAATRSPCDPSSVPGVREVHVVGDIAGPIDWQPTVEGMHAVLHLAARVHVMRDRAGDARALFHRMNVDAPLRLARAAAAAGVARFVYVSSVKAAAERSAAPLREDAPARPEDAYGRSKREAEEALLALGRDTGLEVAIVRPPLVYGPGVGGNFRRLMSLVRLAARIPLPLDGARAPRSLVFVRNLADALTTVTLHPAAAGEIFYVRDGEDLSTSELIRRLGAAVGLRPWLVHVPAAPLRLLAGALGRGAEVERLFGALQVDDAHLRLLLGWRPPFGVDAALAETARALSPDPRPRR
jgi:nucleoside-diphosphate-sugar epimerase